MKLRLFFPHVDWTSFLLSAIKNVDFWTHAGLTGNTVPAESIKSQRISYCNKLAWYRGMCSRTVGWTLWDMKATCLMHLYLHNCKIKPRHLLLNVLFLHCIYRSVKSRVSFHPVFLYCLPKCQRWLWIKSFCSRDVCLYWTK